MIAHRVRIILIIAVTAVMVLGPSALYAQEVDPDTVVLRRIQRAIAEGDAHALLTSAPERLEVSLFGAQTFYSSAQALYVMRDFFRNYPPQRFDLQDISKTENSRLAIGQYWHIRAEQPLQVYIYLHCRNEQWRLEEVRIK